MGEGKRRINYGPDGNAKRVVEKLTLRGPQTRAQLNAHLGISPGTLRSAIQHLKDVNQLPGDHEAIYDLDLEDAQLSDQAVKGITSGKPGKSPKVLMLHDKAGLVAGIEIGRSHLSVGVADANGRLLGSPRIQEESHSVEKETPGDTFSKVARMVKARLDTCSVAADSIRGVAVSIPGPVSQSGETLAGGIMTSFKDLDIPQELRTALDKTASVSAEVFVENDVDVLARGEQRYGKAFGLRDVVIVKCSGGIGAAIVSDERLVRGVRGGGAGEVGHCAIKPEALMSGGELLSSIKNGKPSSPKCQCGKWGCLESFAGGDAIVRCIFDHADNADIDPKSSATTKLTEAVLHAQGGREPHIDVFLEAASMVGLAINTLVHLFNPQKVLVCGKLSELGEQFLGAIRAECQKQGMLFGKARDLILLGTGSTVDERREISVGGAVATALRKAPTQFEF